MQHLWKPDDPAVAARSELLEFGWARSGMRRNAVDSVQKNVC